MERSAHPKVLVPPFWSLHRKHYSLMWLGSRLGDILLLADGRAFGVGTIDVGGGVES